MSQNNVHCFRCYLNNVILVVFTNTIRQEKSMRGIGIKNIVEISALPELFIFLIEVLKIPNRSNKLLSEAGEVIRKINVQEQQGAHGEAQQ